MTEDDIVGQWSLVSWRFEYDDGRVTHPYGGDAKGIIAYQDGRMSCIISARKREGFTSGLMYTASIEDQAMAYATCFAYAGTYTVEGDRVLHQVDASLYPGWDGTLQARASRLEGDLLHLTARTDVGTSEARTGLLTWRRMAVGEPLA